MAAEAQAAPDQGDSPNCGVATVPGDSATVPSGKGGAIVGRLWAYGRRIGFHRQRDLAQHLGVTEETLRKWKLNLATPSESLLDRIAARTAMRREWLLTGEGEMVVPAASTPLRDATAQLEAGRLSGPPGDQGGLQQLVSLEDLVVAYVHAREHFALRGVPSPDARKLLALTLSLYDAAMETLAEPDIAAPPAQNPPTEQT